MQKVGVGNIGKIFKDILENIEHFESESLIICKLKVKLELGILKLKCLPFLLHQLGNWRESNLSENSMRK